MYKTSNAISGSPTFSMRVTKLEDGHYMATALNQDTIKPQTAPTEAEAVRALQRTIQDAMMSGQVEGK